MEQRKQELQQGRFPAEGISRMLGQEVPDNNQAAVWEDAQLRPELVKEMESPEFPVCLNTLRRDLDNGQRVWCWVGDKSIENQWNKKKKTKTIMNCMEDWARKEK